MARGGWSKAFGATDALGAGVSRLTAKTHGAKAVTGSCSRGAKVLSAKTLRIGNMDAHRR